jgi:hypothetical protein
MFFRPNLSANPADMLFADRDSSNSLSLPLDLKNENLPQFCSFPRKICFTPKHRKKKKKSGKRKKDRPSS